MFVDTPFCPGCLFYFIVRGTLGPFVSRFEFGDLEPIFVMCLFIFIESLSCFVLNVFRIKCCSMLCYYFSL